ncbi:IclR family transcriptional regulator C-terminal domain-containing protein [Pseudonocardia nantongensis]|uniref:IclR family transcriptional regulator domain-containing protein n=1 Tax=Pseudonocardia nantongensis TaxID=1181885 RepID=UPI00397D7921
MARDAGPDFIEALARGLDVLTSFGTRRGAPSLSEIAESVNLTRPTTRRILLTLAELGYVRAADGRFALTPRVLELGTAYVASTGLWDMAQPHMEDLGRSTDESCSVAQLDGSDIVYVARVAAPKIVALRVEIGTRFPAYVTSLGKVLLAALPPEEADRTLALPSRSGLTARHPVDPVELGRELRDVRARGWASTDQELALGIRSVAAPLRDGTGRVMGALNVNCHASETSMDTLLQTLLPRLLEAAAAISLDFARASALPRAEITRVH